jgi:hypothetical protein
MSVNGGTQDGAPRAPAGYAWPTADEAAVALACTRIARQIVRSGARSVGLLPFAGRAPGAGEPGGGASAVPAVDLAPLLERLAAAVAAFDGTTVGFIAAWTAWEAEPAGVRPLRPGVRQITPSRCDDAAAALKALERVLAAPPEGIGRLLVDLGGLAPPGRVPAAATAVDKLVAAIVARRVRKAWVSTLVGDFPAGKSLGAILIG